MTDFVPLDGLPAPEITATVDTFQDSMFEIDLHLQRVRSITAEIAMMEAHHG